MIAYKLEELAYRPGYQSVVRAPIIKIIRRR